MKTNLSTAIIVAILIVSSTVNGQEIDQRRMDRDLKIAENILNSLTNKEKNSFFFSQNVESNYIPNYGVILSIPPNTLIYSSSSGSGIAVIAPGSTGRALNSEYTVIAESDETLKTKTDKELLSEYDEQLTELMTIFLADYADLIGQLKASDKIRINVRSRNNRIWISTNDIKSNKTQGKSAEILKGDLIDYKSGKLTRDQLIKKIVFTEEKDEVRKRDLELFSSIFSRLYASDLSDTYYTNRQISYERLENLGVIYNMKVYSTTENDGLYLLQTTGENGLSFEERNKRVNEMYPEFERSLKENILEYGRTVKSLDPSEMLILNVELTECDGCSMPEKIQLSVKANVLKEYDMNRISQEDALKEIFIKNLVE